MVKEKIASPKVCKYCGRTFTPTWSTRAYQIYCSVECRRHQISFDNCKHRYCYVCHKRIYDDTDSRICVDCKKAGDRRASFPKLEQMSGDELLHYGKTQTRFFLERG